VMADPFIKEIVNEMVEAKRQHDIAPAWFQNKYPLTTLTGIAYFSMEFMLTEALAIYSGGLGNVAGDHLKAASDLGVPVIGIGLLYQQGYSRQVIHQNGTQHYVAPFNDPAQLPVTPLRDKNGEWLRIELHLPGYSVWLRTWKVQVGRVSLYLLDSNDAANFPLHRGITNELYPGDLSMRLMQQLILGIGGWRLLKALNISPEVCHLNEGHTAFVILERAMDEMSKHNISFGEAMAINRAGTIFTTHTAIGAGLDVFPSAMMSQYLDRYLMEKGKTDIEEFLALGRQDPYNKNENFNTAFFAIRGSGFINGVSRLHGTVSQQLFANLFPRWPLREVPISYVTNGVHMPTWDSPEADRLWTEACGKDRWLSEQENMENSIRKVSPEQLWHCRQVAKEAFIPYLRHRYQQQVAMNGQPENEIEEAGKVFHPAVFAMGFARRFVAYKRTNLLLKDKERLKRILHNKERPVQLVLAGKAHRTDLQGQKLIREWVEFIEQERLQQKILFLSDYDMLLSEHMVQGVDLWINTPRKPWEACGTSGMKVLVNGGLNISELDGWWAEACSKDVGWGIDESNGDNSEEENDAKEAKRFYDLLEEEILPAFYERNESGIPEGWLMKMRESMATLTPRFSANRSLREYTEKFYLPAAADYLNRSANRGEKGKVLLQQTTHLSEKWKDLFFGEMSVVTAADKHTFRVGVHLAGISPDELQVELYAEGEQSTAEIHQMVYEGEWEEQPGLVFYEITIPANRSSVVYTPRIIPAGNGLKIPLECPLILWQR
jgi:glycogen phosphorylase